MEHAPPLFPGQGAFDLTAFTRTVLATGYAGPLTLDVSNDVLRQAGPRLTAIDAMRSLISVRDGLDPATTPPGSRLTGHAFTELAVDETSGPVLARTLTALGFAHTGQHRTKPVQLWQQGDTRVLLNATPRATAAPGTAEITATEPVHCMNSSARNTSAEPSPPMGATVTGRRGVAGPP